MQQTLLRIATVGLIGFAGSGALLATVTEFVLYPALVSAGIATLAAIAAFLPPRGLSLPICLLVLISAATLSGFVASPAFSAVPQSTWFVIPIATLMVSFAWLTWLGYRAAPRGQEV